MNGNDTMAMLYKSTDCLVGVALWFGTGSQYNDGFVRRHDFGAVLITLRIDILLAKNYLFLPQKIQFFKTKDLPLCMIPWYGSCF
jgi:hypothetical protein